jgi:site-specific recombinase XerC
MTTLSKYAAQWLECLSSRLRPKTIRSYRQLYRLHINPALGPIRFAELKRPMIKELLVDKKRQGLNRNTVRLIAACLSAICSEAFDDGLINSNPAVALGRCESR